MKEKNLNNSEQIVGSVSDNSASENEMTDKRHHISEGENAGHHHHYGEHHHSHHHHHHRHHHRHHHHSSTSSKIRGNKKEGLKQFVRHNRKQVAYITIIFILAVALVAVASIADRKISNVTEEHNASSKFVKQTDDSIVIEIPFFKEDVSLVASAVHDYLNAPASVVANDIFKQNSEEGNNRLDVGLPVKLSYNVGGMPDGYSVKRAEFLVADNQSFEKAKLYTVDEGKKSVDVYHLYTNTQYYYRVSLTLSNGTVTRAEGSFKTADTPRILSVEGVHNLRDIGGWDTASGKKIAQGLLYRGTELDGEIEPTYKATDKGINTMLTVLGIRTDMDLRPESDNKSGVDALGVGVKHIYYNASQYMDAFSDKGKSAMRKMFADLANKNNYPIYLHCTAGKDRTGTLCYVLEALLGVSEDDLMRDYQLTSLSQGELWGLEYMKDFIAHLKTYSGNTMQEKAESYLLSVGVTANEIASIREIFLGE